MYMGVSAQTRTSGPHKEMRVFVARLYKSTLNLNSIHVHKTERRRQRRVSLVHGLFSGIHTSAFFLSPFSLEVADLLRIDLRADNG